MRKRTFLQNLLTLKQKKILHGPTHSVWNFSSKGVNDLGAPERYPNSQIANMMNSHQNEILSDRNPVKFLTLTQFRENDTDDCHIITKTGARSVTREQLASNLLTERTPG